MKVSLYFHRTFIFISAVTVVLNGAVNAGRAEIIKEEQASHVLAMSLRQLTEVRI